MKSKSLLVVVASVVVMLAGVVVAAAQGPKPLGPLRAVAVADTGFTYQGQLKSGGATVSGGNYNGASGYGATVGGGYLNRASGTDATVSGGFLNDASGIEATVPSGARNTASGVGSFAAGTRANNNGMAGAFVWGDSSVTTEISATAPNQFLVRVAGGVGINTNTPVSNTLTVGGAGLKVGNAGSPFALVQSG